MVSRFFIWIHAARPKTLSAAVAPVLVGTAMAVEAGQSHVLSAGLALLSAVFIQVGVNFHNDYVDYLEGADTDDRSGPMRVTQAGHVAPETMRFATGIVFGLAVLAGAYLMYRGGWPILIIGLSSIATAIWYSAGRYSLARLGLADIAVFLFFGPVAVAGTYYVQALTCPIEVVLAGAGPGLFSVSILVVNNVRDVSEDANAGKRTLIVRLGRRFGVLLYAACVLGALFLPVLFVLTTDASPWILGTLLLVPLAARSIRTLTRSSSPERLNPLLATTGRLLVLWALVFSIGWNL